MNEKMSRGYAIAFSNVKASELLNALDGIDDIPESWDEFFKDIKCRLKALIERLGEEERKTCKDKERKTWEDSATK